MCSNTSKTHRVYLQLVFALQHWHALYIVFKVLCQMESVHSNKTRRQTDSDINACDWEIESGHVVNLAYSAIKRDEAKVIKMPSLIEFLKSRPFLSVNIVSIYGPCYDSLSRKKKSDPAAFQSREQVLKRWTACSDLRSSPTASYRGLLCIYPQRKLFKIRFKHLIPSCAV